MESKEENNTLKIVGLIVIAVISVFGLQSILTKGKDNAEINESDTSNTQQTGALEKIQVVHFHATQQCWSCITVGELAEKTIKERFSDEYTKGKIEFIDVNADLNENAEIVKKFGATGSSLFVNVIRDGKDNISEDVQVWRLVSNEKNFISYFESKLEGYLK